MENLKTLSHAFLNKTAVFTVLIPSTLYAYLTAEFGLAVATIFLGIYGVVCDLVFKTLGNFAYVFLLLGLVDLAISIWIPEELLTSTLSLRIQITSLQGALILSVLAILKRPLPMLFAEAFAPDLKELHKQHAKQYVWIWQKISIVWILANLAKAALYQIDFSSEQLFSTVNLLTSWPLGIALVYFAIAYGRREFEKAGWET